MADMMNIEDIKKHALHEINDCLGSYGDDNYFTVIQGGVAVDELEDGYATIEYIINFKFGNCEKSHLIYIGYNEDNGVGIEYGEDSQIEPITERSLLRNLYFDLATVDIEDKYLI